MATEELLNAAVLQLRAHALETYGIIKDLVAAPAEEGVATKIASQAAKLAQYEGGLITLQQYIPSLIEALKEHPEETAEPEEPEELVENEVTPEMSRTMARVTDIHKSTAAAKEKE